MPPLSFRLKDVRSRTELAARLGVDRKTLGLVSLMAGTCKADGCGLPAALNNFNKCVMCRQGWFPVEPTGERLRNIRGHGLYGPQFLRMCSSSKSGPQSCCCESPLCEKIGYSHEGMFCLPTTSAECKEAIRVLGIKSPEQREKILKSPRNHKVAPWHYHLWHRERGEGGKWQLRRSLDEYKDGDGKIFKYPPPNANPQVFIDNEISSTEYARGGYDDSIPAWVRKVARAQVNTPPQTSTSSRSTVTPTRASAGVAGNGSGQHTMVSNVAAAVATPMLRPGRKKRGSPDSFEVEDLKERLKLVEAQLNSALQSNSELFDVNSNLRATVAVERNNLIRVTVERDQLRAEVQALRSKILHLEQQKLVLSYDDLRPGGVLAKHVKDFTYFPSLKSNEKFLEVINFADFCPKGNGLCQNMERYSKVSLAQRKAFNADAMGEGAMGEGSGGVGDTTGTGGGDTGGDDDMSTSSDAGHDLSEAADEAMDEEENTHKRRGRNRKLDWKTEYLVYCFYTRCNISMRRTGALFGISATLVHNIVYAWANLLVLTLEKLFPAPTRSQMLRAYPKSVLRKFGHANIYMLLDATEIFAEVASMKTVNAILYSAYKHKSTLKWLVGCDPIGATWKESITDGYPGSISDPVCTAVTGILNHIPFACAVEVDKGFLIENECALLGIVSIRPMKMLQSQTQQSGTDASLTQKIGKTRIVIEQANGQMKNATNFFDKNIRMDQLGLADLIFRSTYLFQNFKLPFIQERTDSGDGKTGRHCKARIRWYGGTDEGLIDVRPFVVMWGCESEIARWKELRNLPGNESMSDTEISEEVLKEDWAGKLRAQHMCRDNTGDS